MYKCAIVQRASPQGVPISGPGHRIIQMLNTKPLCSGLTDRLRPRELSHSFPRNEHRMMIWWQRAGLGILSALNTRKASNANRTLEPRTEVRQRCQGCLAKALVTKNTPSSAIGTITDNYLPSSLSSVQFRAGKPAWAIIYCWGQPQ